MNDIKNDVNEETRQKSGKKKFQEMWLELNIPAQGTMILLASAAITAVFDFSLASTIGDTAKFTKTIMEYFEENIFLLTARNSLNLFTFFSSSLILSVFSANSRKKTKIRQLIRRNEILEEMVLEDGLTKLLNRRGVQKMLTSLCSRAKRRRGEVHILFIDLDNLKYINSRFGHALGGDVAIARVAQAIQETFRDEDTSGRYGGDEFVGIFIYPSICVENMERTKVVEERLQESISKIHALAIPIEDPSIGYEEIPVGITTAIHIVNLENPTDVELNEASEKMLKLKEEKKKRK